MMELGISKRNYITIGIIIINIIYFLFLETHGGSEDTMVMLRYGAAFPENIKNGEYYRLATSMFMHFGIEHIVNNMLILVLLGGKLEDIMGHFKFFVIYMLSGILANIASDLAQTMTGDFAVSAGASGAIFGVVGALLASLVLSKGKIKNLNLYQIAVSLGLMLYAGFKTTGVDNIAHVGGAVSGVFIGLILYRDNSEAQSDNDIF
ncbi:MAG: rhomboid family intramembrane serine protease [Lachnospiraceae bacterium]|nr:MAG: rhomboid family intramembrane serine protease [Lachnospiraceae bacterium]